jgi:uncharacterized protein (UPF0276 family)
MTDMAAVGGSLIGGPFSIKLFTVQPGIRAKKKVRHLLEILGGAFCENQGRYIQFEYFLSQKHKQIRLDIENISVYLHTELSKTFAKAEEVIKSCSIKLEINKTVVPNKNK